MKILMKSALMIAVILYSTGIFADDTTKDEVTMVLVMKTNMGTIEFELFTDKAPKTTTNFLSYVMESFYDSTVFHRVIKGFMLQCGGYTVDYQKKNTKPPIENEAANGLKNDRGTLAMARTGEIHSATSQFFINHADNTFLDHKNDTPKGFGYCVFGKVTKGMDVVDKIANVSVQRGTFSEAVPLKPVIIESLKVKE
ncbi:peptidylprolyl isomerase [Candidatus Omnitrophota bacterium]